MKVDETGRKKIETFGSRDLHFPSCPIPSCCCRKSSLLGDALLFDVFSHTMLAYFGLC